MMVHYWVLKDLLNGCALNYARSAERPTVPDDADARWVEVDHVTAAAEFPLADGWFKMPIHPDDVQMLPDGWKVFTWKPTTAQRHQAQVNHSGQTLEQLAERKGVRWEELVAILTCNPWRRLTLYRSFTTCRDWPKSVPV